MRARDFVATKHYWSLEKTNQKFIVDEYAGHMTLFSIFSIQALSLELAALAIIYYSNVYVVMSLHLAERKYF